MRTGIGIATTVYDASGAWWIDAPGTDGLEQSRTGARRVSRTATLDGGCVYYDTGFSAADRDIDVRIPDATPADIARAAYLVETYGEVTVSLDDGCYLCRPASYRVSGGVLSIRLMVTARIDDE